MIHLKLFNHQSSFWYMAGIFDSIPIISIVLFVIGLVGVMVYEKTRSKQTEKSTT